MEVTLEMVKDTHRIATKARNRFLDVNIMTIKENPIDIKVP